MVDTTGVLKLIEAGLETACARGKLIMLGATPLGYTLKIPGMAYIAVCLFLFVSLSLVFNFFFSCLALVVWVVVSG